MTMDSWMPGIIPVSPVKPIVTAAAKISAFLTVAYSVDAMLIVAKVSALRIVALNVETMSSAQKATIVIAMNAPNAI